MDNSPYNANFSLTRPYILEAMRQYAKQQKLEINNVVERFSGENLMKLQKQFVDFYGSDEIAREKANSFAFGFGKACELIIKEIHLKNKK